MSGLKLIYFDARGVAELIRLVLKVAEADFEDVRVAREAWAGKKSEMPLKQLPVLEVDGKQYAQSQAIARYLSRVHGLMGSDAIDELRVDEIIETLQEILQKHLSKVIAAQGEEKKKEIIADFIKDNLPTYLDFFEKRLKENDQGNGFFIGKSLTLADIELFAFTQMIEKWYGRFGFNDVFGRPLLRAHYARVEAVPQIAAWLKVRPESEY